ncbi:serine hydrolase domain-containing protein [Paracoccus seriniphilus]|uniref:CubicO group peptidase, beta-lactamase class C family n=1 Tax=Paracoccus seriniphilus TaxID=184748 RepID=A0A239Q2Z3_9RHOB|nr:serine hydrolase domain-containing protein [Paracoccus seriniphilus]WCR12727.1 beta-lactamase family protein [Paracoccus seriniphilus]SNT76865.1 CubicO group peptidase, beta-lactamase class C family [Paracoccus seriniphilus]
MTVLDATLQRLVEREQARGKVHGLLLHVRSADGRLNFKGAAGAADPDIRFPIASISKMFTAALIVQLCDEGALDLDQRVQSALPGVDLGGLHVVKGVDHGPHLTIRQLLFQTSGLADYYEGGVGRDLIRSKDYAYDLSDVLAWARAGRPFAAPDSGRAHYSDTNFQLLDTVIEAACGMSYGEAVQQRICKTLGLTRTALYDAARDGDGRTLPVWHKDKRLAIPGLLSSMGPDGGIVSDTGDLMTFLRAFTEGRLFRPENTSALHQWRKMQFPLQYGGGLMRFRLPGWMTLWWRSPELIGHSGASGSFAYHAPEPDVFLVGTFNQTDAPKRPFSFMLQVLKAIETHGGRA